MSSDHNASHAPNQETYEELKQENAFLREELENKKKEILELKAKVRQLLREGYAEQDANALEDFISSRSITELPKTPKLRKTYSSDELSSPRSLQFSQKPPITDPKQGFQPNRPLFKRNRMHLRRWTLTPTKGRETTTTTTEMLEILISSEKIYLKGLKSLDQIKEALINRKKKNLEVQQDYSLLFVFGFKYFLVQDSQVHIDTIPYVFLLHVEALNIVYPIYHKTVQNHLQNLQRYKENSKHFKNTIRRIETQERINLEHLLKQPLSRILFYTQFFKKFVLKTYMGRPDYEVSLQARDRLLDILHKIEADELLSAQVKVLKDYSKQMIGLEFPLVAADRYFLHKSSVYIVIKQFNSRDKEMNCVCFLFTDLLVYTQFTSKEHKYRVLGTIDMRTSNIDLKNCQSNSIQIQDVLEENVYILKFTEKDQFDLWFKQMSIVQNISFEKRVFGVPLPILFAREKNYDTLSFLHQAFEYLEKSKQKVGIYRESGGMSSIHKLISQLDSGMPLDQLLNQSNNKELTCWVVADVVKFWFRCLPNSLIPEDFHDQFFTALEMLEDEQILQFKNLIDQFPIENRVVLHQLCEHLLYLAKDSDSHKMDVHNLTLLFAPNILHESLTSAEPSSNTIWLQKKDLDARTQVFERILKHFDSILGHVAQERKNRLNQLRTEIINQAEEQKAKDTRFQSLKKIAFKKVRVFKTPMKQNPEEPSYAGKLKVKHKAKIHHYWCTVKYNQFCYFRDSRDLKPKGKIDLTSDSFLKIIPQSKLSFMIVSSSGESYIFVTETETEWNDWIDALNACWEPVAKSLESIDDSKFLITENILIGDNEKEQKREKDNNT